MSARRRSSEGGGGGGGARRLGLRSRDSGNQNLGLLSLGGGGAAAAGGGGGGGGANHDEDEGAGNAAAEVATFFAENGDKVRFINVFGSVVMLVLFGIISYFAFSGSVRVNDDLAQTLAGRPPARASSFLPRNLTGVEGGGGAGGGVNLQDPALWKGIEEKVEEALGKRLPDIEKYKKSFANLTEVAEKMKDEVAFHEGQRGSVTQLRDRVDALQREMQEVRGMGGQGGEGGGSLFSPDQLKEVQEMVERGESTIRQVQEELTRLEEASRKYQELHTTLQAAFATLETNTNTTIAGLQAQVHALTTAAGDVTGLDASARALLAEMEAKYKALTDLNNVVDETLKAARAHTQGEGESGNAMDGATYTQLQAAMEKVRETSEADKVQIRTMLDEIKTYVDALATGPARDGAVAGVDKPSEEVVAQLREFRPMIEKALAVAEEIKQGSAALDSKMEEAEAQLRATLSTTTNETAAALAAQQTKIEELGGVVEDIKEKHGQVEQISSQTLEEVNKVQTSVTHLQEDHQQLQAKVKETLIDAHTQTQTPPGLTVEEVKALTLQILQEKNLSGATIQQAVNTAAVAAANATHTHTQTTLAAEVQTQLYLLEADGVGMIDWASLIAGGSIVEKLSSPTFTEDKAWIPTDFYHKLGFNHRIGKRENVITQGTKSPGDCWPFKGKSGNVTIKLHTHIHPTSVSLEHIPKEVTTRPFTAPRRFRVWGRTTTDIKEEPVLLHTHTQTYFEYDLYRKEGGGGGGKEGKRGVVQTFKLDEGVSVGVKMVTLEVLDNWGDEVFTCLYRFRVHGEKVGEEGKEEVREDVVVEEEVVEEMVEEEMVEEEGGGQEEGLQGEEL